MDGSFGHFKAGQQRKAERNKNKGKFDPSKTNYKSGRAIESSEKLSPKELEDLVKNLKIKQINQKRKQLKVLVVVLVVISSLISLLLLF